MKKFLLMVPVILGQMLFSQNTRFIYQASMKPSKEKADKTTERVYLDVSPSKSVFYSENKLKRDSIMEQMRQTKTFDRSQMENMRSQISYLIEKDPQNQTVTYKDRIGRDIYSYSEKPNMQWTVQPETMKLGDYKVQKATTTYAGREWTAWFTQDVPVMDGPYKFSGLPGLIVKVEDKTGDYSFDLVQTKKIADLPSFQNRGQVITVKKDQYNGQYKKFQSDPESFMQSQNFSSQRGGGAPNPPQSRSGGNGGRQGMDPQQRKEMRQKMLDDIKSADNPLEIQ